MWPICEYKGRTHLKWANFPNYEDKSHNRSMRIMWTDYAGYASYRTMRVKLMDYVDHASYANFQVFTNYVDHIINLCMSIWKKLDF